MSIENTSSLKEARISIAIEDAMIDIQQDAVELFKCIYDINEMGVEGVLVFRDLFHTFELVPSLPALRIDTYFKDAYGVEFKAKYIVTSIKRDISDGSVAKVTLEFVDEYFNFLANTYISKGFKDKKIDEILEELMNSEDKLILDKPEIKVEKGEGEPYKYYATRGNKSLLYHLNHIQKYDNYIFCRNRRTIAMMPADKLSELAPDYSSLVEFTADPNKKLSPFFIYGAIVNPSDKLNENLVFAPCKSYTLKNKEITQEEHFGGKYVSKFGLGTEPLINTVTNGVRTAYYNKNIMDNIFMINGLDQNSVFISVNGMFIHNLLNIVSFRSVSSMPGYKGNMPYISGKYYITRIEDTIQKGMGFTQTIQLGRVGIAK